MPRSLVASFVSLVFVLGSAAPASAQLFESGESGARELLPRETRYVLLLYEDEDFRPSADEDALVAEYRGWAVGLACEGSLVAGEKLDETGMLLETPGGEGAMLPGGEHGSPLGRLGGYFVIVAADRAEALAIAGTNPHLRYGGRIVVRPIVPT